MANLILPETTVVPIQNPIDLAMLAHDLRVRPDWHEPDEQGVDARIIGHSLGNDMGSTTREIGENNEAGEFNVIIIRDGVDVAVINLATLLAWGSMVTPRELRTWEKSE